jgi:hypothetical protein
MLPLEMLTGNECGLINCMETKKLWICLFTIVVMAQSSSAQDADAKGGQISKHNFPCYFEINVGETVNMEGFPPITLLEKRVTSIVYEKIAAAELDVKIGDTKITVPVGYEFDDVMAGDIRIGTEVISDYEKERPNNRYHLIKDARLRIAHAGKPLMIEGSHVFPLTSPWNGGGQKISWLTMSSRYHDGLDFGSWEGDMTFSVCDGIVVSPDDYPELINKGVIYNKNNARIGTNPFLIKDPDLPVLYFYTHLSGLTRDWKEGEHIRKGQIIGYCGDRGSSGGWHHLHFSIVLINDAVCVNPFPFIKEWYLESMPHYLDFLSDFEVYLPGKENDPVDQIEREVLSGSRKSSAAYHNSMPGAVLLKDALVPIPYVRGRDEFWKTPIYEAPGYAVLTTNFISHDTLQGELWVGHTGLLRVYLNGDLVYSGEDKTPYIFGDGTQPFQWDSQKIKCDFRQGANRLVMVALKRDRAWAFTIRPRTRLGLPLPHEEIKDP